MLAFAQGLNQAGALVEVALGLGPAAFGFELGPGFGFFKATVL